MILGFYKKVKGKIMILKKIYLLFVLLFCIFIFPAMSFASTVDNNKTDSDVFVVSIDEKEQDIINSLYDKNLIKSKELLIKILDIAKLHNKIGAGGYKINKNMNELQVVKVLMDDPYMKWVTIPEGFRKEQIAELLAKTLGWKEKQKMEWIFKITANKDEYIEGVYFPDTYLLPMTESGEQVAQRMINRFNEKFSDYSKKFSEKNIKWTTALKIASIVQREAASKEDMPIIAGVIWNRLNKDMKLEIDATVQYVKDSKTHMNTDLCSVKNSVFWKSGLCFESGIAKIPFLYISSGDWWKPIAVIDEKIDSPYNSYMYSGLPPSPICNPGIDAIEAVLNPSETNCIFYLHDANKKIHCAETYDEHLKNIVSYLR